MLQDVIHAVRVIRRRPLLATAAVVTLALGIGGATTVFSVVNAVLLRPLPFEQPEQLVRLYEVTPEGVPFAFSAPNFLDVRAQARSLEATAAFRERGPMVLDDGREPRHLLVVPATGSLPSVLGVEPSLGRFFREEELRESNRLLVLGDTVWRERFAGDPAVLGRSVRLDGEPFTVIGVMAPMFDIPRGAEAWMPLALAPDQSRDDKDLTAIGRLAPGATLESLRAELQSVGAVLSATNARANRGWTIGAIDLEEWLVTPAFKTAVWILFASVGLLLLLACANVAGLLMAQGTARAGEMRIRAALGAGRPRIIRQLLTEAALLALTGTVMGILFSAWSIAALQALVDGNLPRAEQVGIDSLVLAFASVAGVLSCLFFGLTPALHAARVDLRSGMDAGVRHTRTGQRIRSTLVVVEVALALTLLIGAALLANSFVRLMNADPGFRSESLLAFSIDVPPARYSGEALPRFYRTLLDEVRRIPGISAAAATSTDPFRQFGFSNSVTPEERAAAAPASGLFQAGWRSVTPGFFETLGVPLVAGRRFTDGDTSDRERIVIVNETLARQLWPGSDAVGKRIYWGGTTGRTRTVVGVTRDFQDERIGASPGPMLFVPHAQVDLAGMTILARTSIDAGAAAAALREAIRRADPSLPAPAVRPVNDSRVAAAAQPRFNAALLSTFAIIAFVLAVTGVYAMLAFAAEERKRELAIRVALGASGRTIVQHLLMRGLMLTGLGILAGLLLAVGASRALASILYGVRPTDPWSFGVAVSTLIAAAALACYLPARHAARVDPLVLLRD